MSGTSALWWKTPHPDQQAGHGAVQVPGLQGGRGGLDLSIRQRGQRLAPGEEDK